MAYDEHIIVCHYLHAASRLNKDKQQHPCNETQNMPVRPLWLADAPWHGYEDLLAIDPGVEAKWGRSDRLLHRWQRLQMSREEHRKPSVRVGFKHTAPIMSSCSCVEAKSIQLQCGSH